ncbi:MAG: RNA methyltransferase [Myxococcales bacterium]|nr:RNA methyltransferase [Myxococcales bacterium]
MRSRAPASDRIEGVRPVIEAIRAGRRRIFEVELPEQRSTPGLRELSALLEERGIPTRPSSGGPREAAGRIRVLARSEPFPEESFEALLEDSGPRLLVALDRVTDIGNLGSIARSAEAAGFGGRVLEHRHAPPIGPGAIRASAGALEHLRVGRTPNLARALDLARAEGLRVFAAEAGGRPIESLDPELLAGELIWVFGSEDRGIREMVRARADQVVGIPLIGRIDSLGVAAAAAFLLLRVAEARRREWKAPTECRIHTRPAL